MAKTYLLSGGFRGRLLLLSLGGLLLVDLLLGSLLRHDDDGGDMWLRFKIED